MYSIGLQVGPGFFSSFRKGVTLNKLAVIVVVLGVGVTIALHYITGVSMPTMVGVMSEGCRYQYARSGCRSTGVQRYARRGRRPEIATGLCRGLSARCDRCYSLFADTALHIQ